jgi:hypothetical protein
MAMKRRMLAAIGILPPRKRAVRAQIGTTRINWNFNQQSNLLQINTEMFRM